jgi:hypothetical protein
MVESLKRRIRGMNQVWQMGASDLTLEQVNYQEREGVLPIAFTLSHIVRLQDGNISRNFLGEEALWETSDLFRQVGATVEALGRVEKVEEMEHMRFADLEAWKRYQTEVFRRTNLALDSLTEAVLSEVIVEKLEPPQSFPKLILGYGNSFTKFDVLEYYIYLHGVRHVGELEHARSLVGLHGVPV